MRKYLFIFVLNLFTLKFVFTEEINLGNIRGNKLNYTFTSDSIGFCIFVKNPCCHDCILQINKYILNKSFLSNLKYFIILPNYSNIINRREEFNYFKEFFDIGSINFDYLQNDQKSLFTKYNINLTPSILLIKGNKSIVIPNNRLFSSSKLNISLLDSLIQFP